MPFVAGVFFIAGVVFDWMAYEGVGIMVPYGPEPDILHRTSMYGFALGGLLMGFGGQLSGGDLIYHICGQPSKGKWFSLILTLLILSAAVIASSLCNSGYLPLLTNQ